MITIRFDSSLCLCNSGYYPDSKLIVIGSKYCRVPGSDCTPKDVPLTVAHEIGHAILKHDVERDIIQGEAEAWAFVKAVTKLNKVVVTNSLLSYGIATGDQELAKFAIDLLTRAEKPGKLVGET